MLKTTRLFLSLLVLGSTILTTSAFATGQKTNIGTDTGTTKTDSTESTTKTDTGSDATVSTTTTDGAGDTTKTTGQ